MYISPYIYFIEQYLLNTRQQPEKKIRAPEGLEPRLQSQTKQTSKTYHRRILDVPSFSPLRFSTLLKQVVAAEYDKG